MKVLKGVFTAFLVIIYLFVFSCCSCCSYFEKYHCNGEHVESVKIIRLDDFDNDTREFNYTVLCELENHSEFIEKLNKIDSNGHIGDPSVLYEGYIVIAIEYKNGDYDWIHHQAQIIYKSGRSSNGYFHFDEDQFDALIAEYLTE